MPKILTISICIFFILGLGVGLIWPKYQDFKSLELEVSQKKSELKSKKEYLASLESAFQELEKHKDNLSKIESALPSDQSLPSLFDFLQRTSAQSGLILVDIGPVTVSSPKGTTLKESGFNLSLSGSYSSLKNFLPVLEKSARLIEVEKISFSSAKGEEPFSFNLLIKIHSY